MHRLRITRIGNSLGVIRPKEATARRMSTPEPVRIDRRVGLAIHDEQIAQHGGRQGLRDLGLLDFALARAPHAAARRDPEIPALAHWFRTHAAPAR